MLRGGSLFYALAITVIMALVSTSLLMAAHYARMRLQQDEIREEVIRNSNSGIELLMGDPSIANYDAATEIDLFGNKSDSVMLEKKSWGAFEIAIAIAHHKNMQHELIAQIGWQSNDNNRTALVLADLSRPLSVSGNTNLTGDCFLPSAGIQRAYIEGQSFLGNQLVNGSIKKSERYLPKFNDSLVKHLQSLFEFQPQQNDSVIYAAQFQRADSISNSFGNKILYVLSNDPILLRAQFISGQVCIISKTSIRVEKSANIHQALLIAPSIQIEDDVEGDFQAFARDSLLTGKKINLLYPSVLGMIGNDKSPEFATLLLGEKSTVFGQLFACSTSTDFRKHMLIVTQKESLVYGEVYCSDLMDHKGSVFGNVTCAKFILRTNSAEYENHLLNAVINRLKRSPVFVSSALVPQKTDSKRVVQWLK